MSFVFRYSESRLTINDKLFDRRPTINILLMLFPLITETFLDLIFPRFCVGCGVEQTWLCDECEAKIIFVKTSCCVFCGRLTKNFALCSRHRPKSNLSRIYVMAYYEEPLKSLIHTLKFEFIKECGLIIARLLASHCEKSSLTRRPGQFINSHCERGEAIYSRNDIIVTAVPLSKRRLCERGFNQSEIIAKEFSRLLNLNFVSNIVLKTKETPPQVGLQRRERLENLDSAFILNRKYLKKLKGKTVYLVDDVMTTGATLEECAKVLKTDGAKKIFGVIAAKG